MQETTNSIFNQSLYDYVTPRSVLTWQRVTVANLQATTGKEWVEIFVSTVFVLCSWKSLNRFYLSDIETGNGVGDCSGI